MNDRSLIQKVDTLTFDCYGTLIDWEAGMRSSLGSLVPAAELSRDDEFFEEYLRIEAEVEAESYRPYRDVLREVIGRVAGLYGIAISADQQSMFADSVGNWCPFEDTSDALIRLSRRFRLGILSNIDDDLLARTRKLLPDVFDFWVTAETVTSYKPGHAHFQHMIERLDGRIEGWMHVAQSLYHDGVPAAQLNVPFAWINRRSEHNRLPVEPVGVFENVAVFSDWIEDQLRP
jgi:2-haloalkanoic acid dehalogenase type II